MASLNVTCVVVKCVSETVPSIWAPKVQNAVSSHDIGVARDFVDEKEFGFGS